MKKAENEEYGSIGTTCMICGKSFEVTAYYFVPYICPECQKRLMKLLYGEEK